MLYLAIVGNIERTCKSLILVLRESVIQSDATDSNIKIKRPICKQTLHSGAEITGIRQSHFGIEVNAAVLDNGVVGAQGSIQATDRSGVLNEIETGEGQGDVFVDGDLPIKLSPAAGQSGNRKGNDESQRKNESKQFLHLV